jgi:hypothetical protein
MDTFALGLAQSFGTTKGTERNIRIGTWNARSLYRPGSLMTDSREIVKYKLDLVFVQEVKWDKGATVIPGDYISFYGKRIINWE